MGGYESKEFDRLKRRGFKDYSQGHRQMYLSAIDAIGKRSEIFEAGFGIGWGIQQMDEFGIIGNYVGVEPNAASFAFVCHQDTVAPGVTGLGLCAHPNVTLHDWIFNQATADIIMMQRDGVKFDEAFCIEVIEHVPMAQHLQFLIALRGMTKRLWFSSPDKEKSKEGVRTTREWKALLKQARFNVVKVDTSNWTYLYECN